MIPEDFFTCCDANLRRGRIDGGGSVVRLFPDVLLCGRLPMSSIPGKQAQQRAVCNQLMRLLDHFCDIAVLVVKRND
ncbi:hypothetical protein SDC9_68315 [bioreactor metagenome]|uniref:Uncharacterized protein n=1 Tax=bioreactor metagenome TaxID=1076179 RepID=A0A644Y030_9ZZZZ